MCHIVHLFLHGFTLLPRIKGHWSMCMPDNHALSTHEERVLFHSTVVLSSNDAVDHGVEM
jgi:hypothetical protein